MWKRRRTWLLLVALTGVLLAAYFEPSHCVRGWLWGEAFYDGRPTSYWRGVVVQDLQTDPQVFIGAVLGPRPPTWWERVNTSLGIRTKIPSSYHLVHDADADNVLRELMDNDNERVAGFAKDVLTKMRPQALMAHESADWDFEAWLELICKHHREPQDFKKLVGRE